MGLVSGFRAGSPDCRARGQRWAFMFRWSNGRKRAFDRAYPHRLQMTTEEEAGVKERQAKAAASVSKRACPPKRTRVATERACK